MGMDVECCGDRWGRQTCFEGTDGDELDTVCAVMDGDWLIFHYRAALYNINYIQISRFFCIHDREFKGSPKCEQQNWLSSC